ncbi:RICIN domain-containing protein [Longispora urticae]
MRRIITLGIALVAMLVGTLVTAGQPASAIGTGAFMIRSQGVNLCLRGENSAWTEVRAVLCDQGDINQRWIYVDTNSKRRFALGISGNSSNPNILCLTITPAGGVYTALCSEGGYYNNFSFSTMDNDTPTLLAPNGPGATCYLGAGSNGSAVCYQGSQESDKQWIFTYKAGAGGPWEVKNDNSGKCLEVGGWSTANGAGVNQWDCHGGNNQKWVQRIRGYGYEIVNVNSGKCLEVGGWDTANGAGVNQWDCHGGNNQLWQEQYDATARRWIYLNIHSGKSLEVGGWSTANGARVNQWDYLRGRNQAWH